MKLIREPGMQSGFVIQEPFQTIPQLTHVNEAVCNQDYRLGNHRHPGHEFHLLLHGALTWRIGGESFPQRTGELFVIRPRTEHRLDSRPPRNHSFHIFSMGIDLSRWNPSPFPLVSKISGLEHRNLGDCHDLEPVMRSIFRYSLRKEPEVAPIIRALLEVFFLQLEHRARAPREEPLPKSPRTYAIEKALRFMEGNLDRKMTLDELAEVANLAPSHFSNCFRKELGLPPLTYHRNLRLEAARRALRQLPNDLTEIAFRYGFGSVQHFNTAFQKQYGLSPGRSRTEAET